MTGAALVWHDWLEEQLDPQRYDVFGAEPRLPPSAYAAAAARRARRRRRLAAMRYPKGEPAGRGRLQAAARWRGGPPSGPMSGSIPARLVIDAAGRNSGLVRVIARLHGSDDPRRGAGTMVGWVGVVMFVSCLTGIWLWWPMSGGFRRGFRWKRRNSTNANIHLLTGFWIMMPLAMLSFTGVWISFPGVGFGRPAGGAPRRPRPAPAHAARQTRSHPGRGARRRPADVARRPLIGITWPTDRAPEWKFALLDGGSARSR